MKMFALISMLLMSINLYAASKVYKKSSDFIRSVKIENRGNTGEYNVTVSLRYNRTYEAYGVGRLDSGKNIINMRTTIPVSYSFSDGTKTSCNYSFSIRMTLDGDKLWVESYSPNTLPEYISNYRCTPVSYGNIAEKDALVLQK